MKSAVGRVLENERTFIGIYLGSFLAAFTISSAFTALPFIIKHFHGSDAQAGATVSAFHLVYLLVCVIVAWFVDRLRPRITVTLSLAAQGLICLLMWLTVELNPASGLDPVSLFILLCGLWGIALVFLWPPLMGWLSSGFEGRNLNRKLGIYNTSWSCGATLGPLVGGYLTSLNMKLPLIVSAVMFVIAAIAVNLSRKSSNAAGFAPPADLCIDTSRSLPKFRISARLILFSGFFCLGLTRAPLGMLMKYELAFTESHFGTALAILALASTAAYYLLGKFHGWHFKIWPAFVAQAGLFGAILLIIAFDSLATIYIAAVVIGMTTAFGYASHMFYGVSATKRRSGAMAAHEIILSAGIAIGAFFGGYLSDHFGRRFAPYLLGLLIVGLSTVAVLLMHLREMRTALRNGK